MATLVWIDETEDNLIPKLALHAERLLPDEWEGFARPIATADKVGTFLDAWRANDPNGLWGHTTEVGHALIITRPDSDDDFETFPRHGETSDGVALYDLTGWTWTTGPGRQS